MPDEDVERFLWELEKHLADLPGDRRLEALQQVERDLDVIAQRYALEDDRDSTTWHDYVQATADLGPPDRLAASILGHEPGEGRGAQRAFVVAGLAGVLLLAVFVLGLAAPNDFTEVGRWSGSEDGRTGLFNATFEVAPDAERVRIDMNFFPVPPEGRATVLVFDGETSVVFEDTASVSDALQTTRFFAGAPGTWRIVVDLESYTGPWSLTAFEAR